MEEVQTTLMQIPSGLEGIYTKIIRRLEESLTRRAAELTRIILTWVLGSARTLSMDELREALYFQYQAQGHTLLSDGEFPYADKDIENMCGSLVSIRHGQIQTVHQSTKEYLVDLGEDRRLCQGLVILPTSVDTSLGLASICLRYQEKLCKSSLMKLQMSPFSHHPEGFDIRMLQANSKLLDYSFLFWIHHVVSCPTSHRESLVAVILKHFSKFMTVFWMVISMSLDSRGIWRLVIGVEEVEEWLLEGTSRENMGDAARHLQDWCSSITKLLKAYSTLLFENSWTIWRLDLKSFLGQEQRFAAPSNCIDKSEESEESLQSAGQANGLQARSKNPILGHDEWSLLNARLGFFVHGRNQNIFLSGESRTSGEECLFVQHAESGKRLSPATAGLAAVHVDEKFHYGFVVTAKVSAQGKYLAVAYNKWLSIWSIKPNLKFSHRLRDRASAFGLISEAYREGSPEHITAGMIAFEGDDRLFAPRGWYDLATKEFHAFPSMLLDKLRTADSICYSGNCSYLFTEHRRESSQEVSRHSLSLVGLADTISTAFDVASIGSFKSSNTGKYFLLFDYDIPNYKDTSHSSIALFNMATMEMERFPGTENFSSFGECSFHFLEGDDTLVTFLWEPETRRGVHTMMTVTVWGLGPGQPKLYSQGHISTVVRAHPATVTNPPIIATTARDLAWIVSCDRTVQIVRFTSEEISFPGYDPSANEPSVLYSRVSQDGRRLGNIRIMGSKIHLEVINLLPSLQEGFKLEKVFPKTERLHPICLSPNLDLFVVGKFALTIHTETNEIPPPIECDIDLVTPARDCDWACTISSCGEFVAFDKPAYKHFQDYYDRQLGRSVIFRINRTVRMATPLMIPCPEDVQAASPDFHPLLPLAAFSSSEGEGRDNNQTDPRRPQVPANEITLSMIHLIEDRLVSLKPLQMTHRVCPKLYVADTGDFLFLEDLSVKSRIIVSDLPYQSKPLCVIRDNRHIHPSKDRSYMLHCKQDSIEISMYKYQDLAKNSVLPAYQALGSTATVESLTVFSSTLGWPEVWLLLGEDYSKPMRMLLQHSKGESPVMKTLMASWDQLRERLEATLTPV